MRERARGERGAGRERGGEIYRDTEIGRERGGRKRDTAILERERGGGEIRR